MAKKRVSCEKCGDDINLNKDKFVLLGTYTGKKINGESYFHFNCFKKNWEDRVRLQAKNMVSKMAKMVTPMAKRLANTLAGVNANKETKFDF